MASVIVNDIYLTDIGDAIREKNGSTDTYKPSEMSTAILAIQSGGSEPAVIEPLEILNNGTYTAPEGVDGYSPITVNVPQDGAPTDEELTITGNCQYRFAYNGWNWIIEKNGNRITTKDITDGNNMFYNSNKLEEIPFDLNFKDYSSGLSSNLGDIFNQCEELRTIPKISGIRVNTTTRMFYNCRNLREIPDDYGEDWDWGYVMTTTSNSIGNSTNMFYGCYSLRKLPSSLLKYKNPVHTYSASMYYYLANGCYVLDEIVDLPIPYTSTWISNAFSSTVQNTYRLKNFTFALNNGAPYVMNWKGQTIYLDSYVGYGGSGSQTSITTLYNSGITMDKQVTDDATYQALKNDPDWFTLKVDYSRYNHDSAVATINSLPDTSAYLATAGGTNTIKFKGQAGALTDGGAINTLTAEEIAVATAKGWTVTLS